MIYIQIAEMSAKSRKIIGERDQSNALENLLVNSAKQALVDAGGQPEADISLVLADNAWLNDLNRAYLGVDAPTDVLAFPGGEVDPESGQFYLGDIVISVERAAEQAEAGGHPLNAELQLLVVHGMLHLCGYDHADPHGKADMWEKQAEILRRLNCPIHSPPFETEA